MKKLLALLMLSFSVIAGEEYGTYDDSPYKKFDARKNNYSSMTITWRTSSNVSKECTLLMTITNKQKPKITNFDGCAYWNGDKCIIITDKKTSLHTLGHEIRHCFQGAWH